MTPGGATCLLATPLLLVPPSLSPSRPSFHPPHPLPMPTQSPPQLVAGEQIDHAFGARLSLTTLASAALGNLVADGVGVSATQSVQENIKRFGVAKPPRLR